METLIIGGENSENLVELNEERGIFEFAGRFLPSKPKEFFEPIILWFEEYVRKPHKKSVLIFKLDYFNTSSSKKILDIMLMFYHLQVKGFEVEVEWYFHKEDVDIKDAGHGYADLVEIPFKYKEY